MPFLINLDGKIIKSKFEFIVDNCEIYTMNYFYEKVQIFELINYDGFAHPIVKQDDKYIILYDVYLHPSEIETYRQNFHFVAWYNR